MRERLNPYNQDHAGFPAAPGGEGLNGGTAASGGSATSRREILVAFAEPLARIRPEEFARLVYFVDESIEEFEFSYGADGNVTGVRVTAGPEIGRAAGAPRPPVQRALGGDFSRRPRLRAAHYGRWRALDSPRTCSII